MFPGFLFIRNILLQLLKFIQLPTNMYGLDKAQVIYNKSSGPKAHRTKSSARTHNEAQIQNLQKAHTRPNGPNRNQIICSQKKSTTYLLFAKQKKIDIR